MYEYVYMPVLLSTHSKICDGVTYANTWTLVTSYFPSPRHLNSQFPRWHCQSKFYGCIMDQNFLVFWPLLNSIVNVALSGHILHLKFSHRKLSFLDLLHREIYYAPKSPQKLAYSWLPLHSSKGRTLSFLVLTP